MRRHSQERKGQKSGEHVWTLKVSQQVSCSTSDPPSTPTTPVCCTSTERPQLKISIHPRPLLKSSDDLPSVKYYLVVFGLMGLLGLIGVLWVSLSNRSSWPLWYIGSLSMVLCSYKSKPLFLPFDISDKLRNNVYERKSVRLQLCSLGS